MILCKTVREIRSEIKKHNGKTIGFVPTMGALHEGHLSIIRTAKKETQYCVVSIYLNSTQFNNPDDLKSYPTSLNQDLEYLSDLQVDCVFLPNYQEVYPDNYRYQIHETEKSLDLCGKDRPGHFDGVLSVVMKLFNIVKPTQAYFGEKDFQQLQLIKGMVKAFFMDIKIVACATVRDSQGLALSSRNKRLNEVGIKKAHYFAKQLKEQKNLDVLTLDLEKYGIGIDYLKEVNNRRYAAVKIENVRLIDNVEL